MSTSAPRAAPLAVPPAQSTLAELLAERVEWVTGCSAAFLRDTRTRASTQCTQRSECGFHCTPDATVLVLLRSLELPDIVHGARAFAAALDPEEAATWRRSWTRTRFLFGNPANLTAGNPARVVAPGGSAAWLGPFPDARTPGLHRLLKPVTGELPELPRDVDIPGNGPARVLRIAVAGLTLVDYLVHLHHTLAEAVLLGRLRPEESLLLRHEPVLGIDAAPAYARVLPEPGDTGRLRLHSLLSSA